MNEIDKHLERIAELNPAPIEVVERESEGARRAARAKLVSATVEDPTSRKRSRRPLRIALLASLGALALVVVGLARGGDGGAGGDGFDGFAAIAAEQSSDGLRYVSWTSRLLYDRPEHWAQGARYPDQIDDRTEVDLWLGNDVRFEQDLHRYWDGTDQVVRSTYLADLSAGFVCWGGFEGMPQKNCMASNLINDLSDSAELAKLPLDPEELRVALEKRMDAVDEPTESDLNCMAADGGFGLPIPMSLTTGSDRQTLLTDLRAAAGLQENRSGWTYRPPRGELLFMTVTGLLSDPQSSPELRAALFEVLAGLDGARLAPDAEDRLGREAAVIEYESPPDERAAHDQVFVDPETSEVLEQRTTVEETDGSSEPTVIGTYYRVFTENTEAATLPQAAEPFETAMRRFQAECIRDERSGRVSSDDGRVGERRDR